MIYFKLIFVSFILFTFSTKANDVEIIELHKNKSLDQLVLETENNENDEDNEKMIKLIKLDKYLFNMQTNYEKYI